MYKNNEKKRTKKKWTTYIYHYFCIYTNSDDRFNSVVIAKCEYKRKSLERAVAEGAGERGNSVGGSRRS